jgi:FlaA1/EpsC-like NDP-sugar epimerase
MIRLSGLEPDKDIPLVFTEPRPGEKLFEEILTVEEGAIITKNQKIFMAKLSKTDKMKLESGLRELKKAAEAGNKEKIREILKNLVPSYQST